MLNLVHLRVLAAVARHGSVTEAARELHYSQPSVSRHLSRLEAATGAKLVQRVGRGIRLTPEGQLLAHRAAEIVGRVDAAATELAAQVDLQAGRVRLAANASALSTIVPRAAPRWGGVSGDRAEPARPAPGRVARAAAPRGDRRRPRLPLRRRPGRGGGLPPGPHRRGPDLSAQPATR